MPNEPKSDIRWWWRVLTGLTAITFFLCASINPTPEELMKWLSHDIQVLYGAVGFIFIYMTVKY